MNNQVSFIPIGGVGDVTKNMYLYEYNDQILIVDCGLGFADETMVGVDLLLPDVSYLLSTNKKIVGMVLTHGHEDHIGSLPYVLPQLISGGKHKPFSIFGSPLTAALANEKLKEFGVGIRVEKVNFKDAALKLGDFKISFVRVTHSIPDASNLFIETPGGNFYHASDFKFDLTPVDGQKVEFEKIISASSTGIVGLMSDCLGAEKAGYTLPERAISESFRREIDRCTGKVIITTYSSNISRLNQAIKVAGEYNRKVCFVGRSLIKAKEVAAELDYLKLKEGIEITVDQLKRYNDNQILLFVAGSQGQENSAMTRIASGEHREVKLGPQDVVIFSSDAIPGNETAINSLIDSIAKKGTKVVYSELTDQFHVSGHGSSQDLMLMMSLVKPSKLVPIGGTYKQMVAYRDLAKNAGYKNDDLILLEDGQEVIFTSYQKGIEQISSVDVKLGRKIETKNVYVDEITGEELENFVLRDRQRLSEGGIIIILVEIDTGTGQVVNTPDIIMRGIVSIDQNKLSQKVMFEIRKKLGDKKGRVTNWVYIRRLIGEIAERTILREFKQRPLVLPVVIEV
ncbi:MAG: ribonuclease J [Patescibacteria group bacterium]|nr:ribonuclease J [Patescibacteria group bacterium]